MGTSVTADIIQMKNSAHSPPPSSGGSETRSGSSESWSQVRARDVEMPTIRRRYVCEIENIDKLIPIKQALIENNTIHNDYAASSDAITLILQSPLLSRQNPRAQTCVGSLPPVSPTASPSRPTPSAIAVPAEPRTPSLHPPVSLSPLFRHL